MIIVLFAAEGGLAREQLVHHTPERPPVRLEVMTLVGREHND